jgi:hypothetical protein
VVEDFVKYVVGKRTGCQPVVLGRYDYMFMMVNN